MVSSPVCDPASSLPELAIILPTLDEAGNLAPLIAQIDAALCGTSWEAIIVDDNSRDGTIEEARELARADARVKLIVRDRRSGLSSAVIEGVAASNAAYVAVMDADHQHDPALLPRMLDAVRGGEAQVAVASRYVAGGDDAGLASRPRSQGSRLANRLTRWLTGVKLSDPMSGYFLLPGALAQTLSGRLSGIGFKVLIDLLASADQPLTVTEVPLVMGHRHKGQSKLDQTVAFEFLVALYHRVFGGIVPVRFALFGTVGAVGMVRSHGGIVGDSSLGRKRLCLCSGAGNTDSDDLQLLAQQLADISRHPPQRGQGHSGRMAGILCSLRAGAVANVAVAGYLEGQGTWWAFAGLAGIMVGAVWNYALSSRFVWGGFRLD